MNKLTLKTHLKKKLARLDDAAGELTYIGNDPNHVMKGPIVAVVGTRKPTPYGKQITEQIVTELARADVTIVSGLAFGVDILAAKSALAEDGTTIAILPSGLHNVYPASHAKIAKQIQEKGSLISEYPADHRPMRHDFLHRNRLIAAMSDLVIIPEAAERSGSLNTARHARSMGIIVCAVPGPTTSSMSRGTNNLIKNGEATMITNAQDILDMLNIKVDEKKKLTGSNDNETTILKAIGGGLSDSILIQQETSLETDEFQTALTMLEIDGKINQDELGKWHLS